MRKRPPGKVELERALSKLGLASRAVARQWILEGQVQVAGRVIRDPLHWVTPERTVITVAGQSVSSQAPCTILLHKPKGFVTTRSDEKGRATVFDLMKDFPGYLVAVGRLDLATTGLLLLTNDTQLSSWLTDPVNAVERVYVTTVRGEFTEAKATQLRAGIQDQGETLQADRIEIRKTSGKESQLLVTLREGKNREIRRMFLSLGHEVTRLKRISFGGLGLGNLAVGSFREISPEELRTAFPGAPLRG